MTYILLNAGNLWTDSYLSEVIELNRTGEGAGVKVGSLFGSIAGLTPTARSTDRLPVVDMSTVTKYIDKAQSNNINIRYTLNPSCIGSIQDFKKQWDESLRPALLKLHDWGVHEWTITSALMLILVRDLFPDDFIEVSTIAEVSTAEDATRWLELGADGVNVSTNINRNFPRLVGINEVLKVSILANEACLYRCPYRRDCYNFSSHDSNRGKQFFDWYPFRNCNEVRMDSPVEWVKARMVLPQWMQVYQAQTGINWFKIAYRTHPEEVALPILRLYMQGKHYGNLCELWPTIAALGNTDEPAKSTYISCLELDRMKFLDKWIKGEDCDDADCGVGCSHCYKAYSRASVRK